MDKSALEVFKKRLESIKSIQPIAHGFKRIQDKRRKLNYSLVYKVLKNTRYLISFEQGPPHPLFPNEERFKLIFQLNRDWGMVIVVSIKDKHLKIVTAYKIQLRRMKR